MNRNASLIVLALSAVAALALVPAFAGCDGADSSTTETTSTATTTATTSGEVCSAGEWQFCGTGGAGGAGGSSGAGGQDALPLCGARPNICRSVQVCDTLGNWTPCVKLSSPSTDDCDPFDCDGINRAEPTSCLSEDVPDGVDALVRYYIDEKVEGAPTTLVNSAPSGDPYNLTIQPANQTNVTYFEAVGQSGVRWTDKSVPTNANVFFDDSTVTAALDRLTIEVVLDIDEIRDVSGSFVVSIGQSFDDAVLILQLESADGTSTQPDAVSLYWNNFTMPVARWAVSSGSRRVLHVVVDTSAAEGAEKVSLYADGVLIQAEPKSPSTPSPDGALALAPGDHLVLGNSFVGARAFVGKLYYTALYPSALPPETVRRHAEILRCDDDRPGF